MSKPVLLPDKERDVFFKDFCKGANKACIDCGSPNPQWATAYFGILFCLECSGKHRSLGTHLTFVRSISMDSWKYGSVELSVELFGGSAQLSFPAGYVFVSALFPCVASLSQLSILLVHVLGSVHEIAAMRAGGNAAMIEWWAANGVDARAPIPTKYAHPATQAYREKIKANVAGKDYVPAPVSKNASSSLLSRSGPSYANSPSSPALSKSTGSSSYSSSSSASRKPKKKSSSKKAAAAASGGTATGVLFSFGDDGPSPAASAGSASDDSDEEAFESFVSAKPKPQAVPDYSDARLRQYEGATSFGSDDLDGTKKAAPPPSSTEDIFSALSTGWTKIAQVANTTKDKLVESTAGLKQKVEQSQISERATSFIQSLWSGMDPSAEQQQQPQQQSAVSQPPQASRSARQTESETDGEAWLDRPAGPRSAEADDGWGAWDGEKDDEDITAPASGKGKSSKDDDSWGAWKSAPAAPAKEKTKQPTAATPVAAKKAAEPALVNLDFATPVATPPSAASKDGWDDWAFSIK